MKMIIISQFFQAKNNTVVIEKIRIESFEILKSEEIKNKREFSEDALNYSQNCFFPTAYITEDNKLFFNSHYDLTYNLKAGINKNFGTNCWWSSYRLQLYWNNLFCRAI